MKVSEFQSEFLIGITKGKPDLIDGVARKIKLFPSQRLSVYRTLVQASLEKALNSIYRRSRIILGETLFAKLRSDFISVSPSRNPNLNFYGEGFPGFLIDALKNVPNPSEFEFLPDLSKLEWALNQAQFAPDTQVFDLQRFARVEEKDRGRITFSLCPSLSFIRSNFPIFRIFEIEDEDLPKLNTEGALRKRKPCYLIIQRSNFQPSVSETDYLSYRLLRKIKAGCALRDLGVVFNGKDEVISRLIQSFISLNWIRDFSISPLQSQRD